MIALIGYNKLGLSYHLIWNRRHGWISIHILSEGLLRFFVLLYGICILILLIWLLFLNTGHISQIFDGPSISVYLAYVESHWQATFHIRESIRSASGTSVPSRGRFNHGMTRVYKVPRSGGQMPRINQKALLVLPFHNKWHTSHTDRSVILHVFHLQVLISMVAPFPAYESHPEGIKELSATIDIDYNTKKTPMVAIPIVKNA